MKNLRRALFYGTLIFLSTAFVRSGKADVFKNNLIAFACNIESGNMILDHNSLRAKPFFSTPILMITYLVLEAVKSGQLSLYEKISYPAANNFTESVTLLTLLRLSYIKGDHQALTALVKSLNENTDDFTAAMNIKAGDLGMKDTYFSYHLPTKDSLNYSTARDVALLMVKLYNDYQSYLSLINIPSFVLRGDNYSAALNIKFLRGIDANFTGAYESYYEIVYFFRYEKSVIITFTQFEAQKNEAYSVLSKLTYNNLKNDFHNILTRDGHKNEKIVFFYDKFLTSPTILLENSSNFSSIIISAIMDYHLQNAKLFSSSFSNFILSLTNILHIFTYPVPAFNNNTDNPLAEY